MYGIAFSYQFLFHPSHFVHSAIYILFSTHSLYLHLFLSYKHTHTHTHIPGVCIHPMSIILELTPLGTLSVLLYAHIEQLNEDRASGSLRMHGGVLGHVLSTRIALQVKYGHQINYHDIITQARLLLYVYLDRIPWKPLDLYTYVNQSKIIQQT